MIYNVRTIQYLNSLQVRVYSKPIKITKEKINVRISDNQKIKSKRRERTEKQIKHCAESSVNRTVNKIYDISRSNKWEYFVTLTINPKLLDSTDYDLLTGKLSKWLDNLKQRYCPDLMYIFVPEFHKDKRKIHFHGLISNIGQLPFEFSGKVCVGKYTYDYIKKPYATKIYNLPLWKYGFSTATKIRDTSKASSYITKYITKDLIRITNNKRRFLASQNCLLPQEKAYNACYESIEDIITRYCDRIDYMSNVKVPDASLNVTYIEFNSPNVWTGKEGLNEKRNLL